MRSTALALSCKSQTRTANAKMLLHNSIVVPIYSYLYRICNHVMMQELTVHMLHLPAQHRLVLSVAETVQQMWYVNVL
jgi:hypothetical protein